MLDLEEGSADILVAMMIRICTVHVRALLIYDTGSVCEQQSRATNRQTPPPRFIGKLEGGGGLPGCPGGPRPLRQPRYGTATRV